MQSLYVLRMKVSKLNSLIPFSQKDHDVVKQRSQ